MTPMIFLRSSALPRYSDCPRRAAAQMFRGKIEASGFQVRRLSRSIAAAVGIATHRSAQVILSEKARCGELPPATVATDAARDALSKEIGLGETTYDQVTSNQANAVRQVIAMSKSYHRAVAPGIQPLLIEQKLEAQIDENLVLVGRPDIVAIEPGQIDDLKTGTRPANHNAQIGSYSLLVRSAGIQIDLGAIDFIPRVLPGKPQPEPVRTVIPLAIAEQTAANVLRHIGQDLRVFMHGDDELRLRAGDPAAFLANPNSQLCSAKYCPAHGTNFCREWQKEQ